MLDVERRGPVAIVTLNRPEAMNALSKALRKALGSTGWHELKTDDGEVRIDLARIVYIQTDGDSSRVGFGV